MNPTQRILTLSALVASAGFLNAQQIDWDAGGDGSTWNDGINWSDNNVPSGPSGAIYFFGRVATTTGSTTNDITGLTLTRINTSGGAWTLGGNQLTLQDSGATQARLFTNSSGDSIYNMDLVLAGTQNILIEVRATAGADTIFNGVISGSQGLEIANVGSTTASQVFLNGTNTFTGGIVINDGTPGIGTRLTTVVGDTDAFNNNAIVVGSGGADAQIIFDQATDGTFSGTFNGNGAFIKRGDGILTLTNNAIAGTAFAGGNATIESGAVKLEAINGLGSGEVLLGAASGTNSATLELGNGLSATFDQNINVVAGSTGSKAITSEGGASGVLEISSNIAVNDNLSIESRVGNASRILSFTGDISGTGDLLLRAGNVQGNRIQLGGANSALSGDVLIVEGNVYGASNDAFGTGTIRLGSATVDSFAALSILSNFNIDNNIIVAGGSTGRRLTNGGFGGDADGTTVNGNITLNNDLQVEAESVASGGDAVTLAGIVSGSGGLLVRTQSVDSIGLSGVNTYEGNTTIETGATLNLNDNAALTFYIGADGLNNQITGLGTVNLDGDFIFDLTSAAATGTWTIVGSDLASAFGSTFTVAGWTETSGVWASGDYRFSELSGELTVVPEPGTYALLAGMLSLAWVMVRRRK